jgi:hypothetical protein
MRIARDGKRKKLKLCLMKKIEESLAGRIIALCSCLGDRL